MGAQDKISRKAAKKREFRSLITDGTYGTNRTYGTVRIRSCSLRMPFIDLIGPIGPISPIRVPRCEVLCLSNRPYCVSRFSIPAAP
jgi:hypothetical protein